MTSKKTIVGGSLIAIFVVLTVAAVAFDIAIGVKGALSWDPTFNKAVHGHMQNAYDAYDPALMKAEVQKAIDGFRALRLDPNVYDTTVPWEQTPDRQMSYQYAHMQAIIDRIDAVQAGGWCSGTGAQSAGSQINDVCGEKINAIRHLIKDDGGWSDQWAHGVYYVSYHPLVSRWVDFGVFIFVGWVILGLILCGTGAGLIYAGRTYPQEGPARSTWRTF